MSESPRDDLVTVIAIAAIACVLGDILHEGVGHGVTAWLSGAHRITMSTVALESDVDTRLISANGTLVNLLSGGIFWLLLRRGRAYRPTTRYFLALAMMGNLFSGTGYFLFSGVVDFGDWAAVIRGLEPHWAWRAGLIVGGIASYWAAMVVVGAAMAPFRPGRYLRLCYTPYFSDGMLAGIAGLLNPLGFFYVLASALPSTLGAKAGLLSLPFLIGKWNRAGKSEPAGPIERSSAWIAGGVLAILFFILILGRGLTFTR